MGGGVGAEPWRWNRACVSQVPGEDGAVEFNTPMLVRCGKLTWFCASERGRGDCLDQMWRSSQSGPSDEADPNAGGTSQPAAQEPNLVWMAEG